MSRIVSPAKSEVLPNPISTISSGDIVVLKSGGPYMTVEEVNKGLATCVWFTDGDVRDRAYFNCVTLDPAPLKSVTLP